jgi:hypothetical protein
MARMYKSEGAARYHKIQKYNVKTCGYEKEKL